MDCRETNALQTHTCPYSLNTLELKSLEEPGYLMEQFFKHPQACLGLVPYVTQNTGVVLEMSLGFCLSVACVCVCEMGCARFSQSITCNSHDHLAANHAVKTNAASQEMLLPVASRIQSCWASLTLSALFSLPCHHHTHPSSTLEW